MGRKSREKRERRRAAEQLARHYQSPPPVKYPVWPQPSRGNTSTERKLAALARRTFLSTWSYPNVFRDETRADGTTFAHEVADLLVVFERHVVVFSDKDCEFPSGPSADLNWSRWFRRAIAKSASQVHGAERWIRKNPHRLFLDASLKSTIPLTVPPSDVAQFHRVVVAHGAGEACKRELGGSGTLQVAPTLVGDADHVRAAQEGGRRFAVGDVAPGKGFLHVFDDLSLEVVMRERDTVADFVHYLEKRERLIRSGVLSYAAGEEALMGWYLRSMNEDLTEHDFVIPKDITPPVAVDESWWHAYYTSPRRRRKLDADRVSYVWDAQAELFAKHFRAGTADHLTETDPAAYERVLRFFARETRLRRRLLGQNLIDMHQTTPPHMRRLRFVPPTSPGDPVWVLLLVPFGHEMDYRLYREARREYLSACVMVAKLKYPNELDFVGFATESGRGTAGSEDLSYLDARQWSAAYQAEAERLSRDLQIMVSPRLKHFQDWEFPRS